MQTATCELKTFLVEEEPDLYLDLAYLKNINT